MKVSKSFVALGNTLFLTLLGACLITSCSDNESVPPEVISIQPSAGLKLRLSAEVSQFFVLREIEIDAEGTLYVAEAGIIAFGKID